MRISMGWEQDRDGLLILLLFECSSDVPTIINDEPEDRRIFLPGIDERD